MLRSLFSGTVYASGLGQGVTDAFAAANSLSGDVSIGRVSGVGSITVAVDSSDDDGATWSQLDSASFSISSAWRPSLSGAGDTLRFRWALTGAGAWSLSASVKSFPPAPDGGPQLSFRANWVAGELISAMAPVPWTSGLVNSFTNQQIYNTNGTSGDSIVYDLMVAAPAGTYTLKVSHQIGGNDGIATFETSPDGTTFTSLTTMDFYDSGADAFTFTTRTGLVIAAPFRYLRCKTVSKNAATAAFYIPLVSFALAQTA